MDSDEFDECDVKDWMELYFWG
ncbi:uncharacterized protein FTOL_09999 [Fusarium torulosum]|uniref:Uncharacterized protein n=1 Tax=Fusarium torulosum TaxID=33205 RepID=A0AAE8SM39_9HYPO|nr:uncharacterized protein FTOL_09999 [Fusarium torulosum]